MFAELMMPQEVGSTQPASQVVALRPPERMKINRKEYEDFFHLSSRSSFLRD
jgi:hypothetical protein